MTRTIHSTIASQKSPLATKAEGSATKEPISADALRAWAIEILKSAFSVVGLMQRFHIVAGPQWMKLNSIAHFAIAAVTLVCRKTRRRILPRNGFIWKKSINPIFVVYENNYRSNQKPYLIILCKLKDIFKLFKHKNLKRNCYLP